MDRETKMTRYKIIFKEFNLVDIDTKQKKKEYITIKCKHCGKDKEVDAYLVWTKFCDIRCFKEYQAEQRNIKKILAVKSKFVV
jgi:hypothetical protein